MTDQKLAAIDSRDCWVVVCGRDFHLGVGVTIAQAVEDARRRLLELPDLLAYDFLLQLLGEVPAVFVGDYPPAGCLGLMQIPPLLYAAMRSETGIWTPQRPLPSFPSD
jgi:hypothetical protein